MITLDPERIAAEARATISARGVAAHPERAVINSGEVLPDDLFVGLPGQWRNGGEFAEQAIEAGAWGVLVSLDDAERLGADAGAWVLASNNPLRSFQRLARGWRRELGCKVVGVTGSSGKTTVKDIARAILPARVHASVGNLNTEIGLPMTILAAEPETEVMVLEMGMRGRGQISELCDIAEPDVAAITNVGPVHLELLGTIDAIAEAKAEILGGLGRRGRAVVPAAAEALSPHLHDSLLTFTFGAGGEVHALDVELVEDGIAALVSTPHGERRFVFPFAEEYNLANALCAIAIGIALDLPVEDALAEMAERAQAIEFSELRGESVELRRGIVLINDTYNANPLSMRAALDHLGSLEPAADGRRVVVLGEMRELGPDSVAYHREVGAHARELGLGPIFGIGGGARDYAPDQWFADIDEAIEPIAVGLHPRDIVLLKASRSVALEQLTDALADWHGMER